MSNSELWMPTQAIFQAAIEQLFQEAIQKGQTHLDLNSGELHRMVGGYPGTNHRMPLCCAVMRQNMQNDDIVLDDPPKGVGASVVIRYKLPR